MALYTLAPQPWLIFLDDGGIYVPNGQLAIYEAGTTTPALVYSDSSGTPHPFPITLDGTGRVQGGVYLQPGLSYKFVLHAPKIEEPLDGAVIRTQDNVGAVPLSGGSILTISTPGDYTNLNVSGVDIIDYVGGGDVAIRGMTGGVNGQQIMIRNRGNATVWLYSADAAAPLVDRLYNFFIIGPTPLNGPPGMARYSYTTIGGIGWVMDAHEQGRPITPAYNVANYSAAGGGGGTWVVDPADIALESFYLQGRNVFFSFRYNNTTITGAPDRLERILPFGWQALSVSNLNNIMVSITVSVPFVAGVALTSSTTRLAFQRLPITTAWPAIADSVVVYGQISIPLN